MSKKIILFYLCFFPIFFDFVVTLAVYKDRKIEIEIVAGGILPKNYDLNSLG